MPEQLWFTSILNRVLGGPVNAILQALPPAFHPANPQAPITNGTAMEILVVGIILLIFLLVRSRLSVDKPGGLQHLVEMLDEFVSNQSEEIIGHHSERFTPYLLSLFLLILLANMIGLIPGFESPTSDYAMPLGLAVLTFIYYNVHGIRAQGPIGYLKHFMGPVWWLAWLLFPIEIFSHSARLLSLTVRLRANIFAGDKVTGAFFNLIPLGVPVIFLMLHVAVAILQAYVFTLLATIYLQGAVAEPEH